MTAVAPIEAPIIKAPMKHGAGQHLQMWAVWRDDEIYLIRPSRDLAQQERDILSLGNESKHKWYIHQCWVSP